MAYSGQTLANLARPSNFDPFGAIQEGQDRKMALADRAMAQADQQFDRTQKVKAAGIADHDRKLGEITGVLGRADTPEKWARGVQFLKARGHDFDPGEEDFANRDSILGQAMSLKEQMAQGNVDRNFNADENYRTKSLDIEERKLAGAGAKARTQISDVGGKRVLIDLDTGETLKELGPTPAKAKSGLTATELKFQRESEGDQLNLGQTVSSLERAAQLTDDTFEGVAAGAKAYVGSRVPGGSFLVDKAGADATTEYSTLMSPEAIKEMASTLKGATTDFELRKFESILSDPSQPNDIKKKVIGRMLTLAKQKLELEGRRLKAFETDAPEQSGGYEGPELPTLAVEELLADPSGAAEFDEVFGPGAAQSVLGQ